MGDDRWNEQMALIIYSCLLQLQHAGIIVRRTESVSTFTGWLETVSFVPLGILKQRGGGADWMAIILWLLILRISPHIHASNIIITTSVLVQIYMASRSKFPRST